MIMGENPNKVQNIVSSNIAAFDLVYIPIIQQLHSSVEVIVIILFFYFLVFLWIGTPSVLK